MLQNITRRVIHFHNASRWWETYIFKQSYWTKLKPHWGKLVPNPVFQISWEGMGGWCKRFCMINLQEMHKILIQVPPMITQHVNYVVSHDYIDALSAYWFPSDFYCSTWLHIYFIFYLHSPRLCTADMKNILCNILSHMWSEIFPEVGPWLLCITYHMHTRPKQQQQEAAWTMIFVCQIPLYWWCYMMFETLRHHLGQEIPSKIQLIFFWLSPLCCQI